MPGRELPTLTHGRFIMCDIFPGFKARVGEVFGDACFRRHARVKDDNTERIHKKILILEHA